MRSINWERWAAASGFAFVLLFIIAFFVPGKPPSPGDSRGEWTSFVLDKTKEVKISAILFGLAGIAFLWFLGSVGGTIRGSGQQRLAAIAFGSGVTLVAMAYVMSAVQATIAWRLASDEPQLVRAFADVTFGMQTLISFPAAALVYAVAVASWRTRAFPQWYCWGSGVVALALVFGGATLKQTGFYSPDGAYAVITLIAFLAWVLVTTALLAMKAEPAKAPAAAATTP